MPRPELTEPDYLRELERLARAVTAAAAAEGTLTHGPDPIGATALHRAVNALARAVRHHHFPGDGCLPGEEDRPTVRLVGVVLLRPSAMPAGTDESYGEACARLAVEPRSEGWALWNTWGDGGAPVTLVVTDVAATEALLAHWAHGGSAAPVTPLPSQIVAVRQGWTGPMTFSPQAARGLGVPGLP
ncbi:hypothetical protein ABZX99_35010 [Streptomyces antibioticus]|uniref:hypothetical protein n=1 Tax=Streptomyces antibioticus TaxID=1890 RepID=UPI00339E8358